MKFKKRRKKNNYIYFLIDEAKRSLSVSAPSKKRLADKQNNNSKYGEHLNLINVNFCSEENSNNQCLKSSLQAPMQAPSIHISENPLSNATCTCLNRANHSKLKQNDKHQYFCLLHHQDHHSHQIYNSQNQFLTNTNLQLAQLNQLNQFNQLNQQSCQNQSNQLSQQQQQQRNSIQNIPLNLINAPSKTPSKESIFQQSEFNSAHTCLPPIDSPSVISMGIGKCESIAHSLILAQQQQQTLKRPSFAQISPQNAISNSSTSNNLMANARQDRLFSVGPSFHVSVF